MNLSRVLRRPIVTEKSTLLQEQGKYTFEIHPQATKKDVSRAVESFFDVHVKSVNTMRQKGKMKRFGRGLSKMPDRKKAIVTLAAGESIQLFEGA